MLAAANVSTAVQLTAPSDSIKSAIERIDDLLVGREVVLIREKCKKLRERLEKVLRTEAARLIREAPMDLHSITIRELLQLDAELTDPFNETNKNLFDILSYDSLNDSNPVDNSLQADYDVPMDTGRDEINLYRFNGSSKNGKNGSKFLADNVNNIIRESMAIDPGRRLTRSMRSSIIVPARQMVDDSEYSECSRETFGNMILSSELDINSLNKVGMRGKRSVPQTPKFHPGLPETPAAVRNAYRRQRLVDESKEQNLAAKRETFRLTRSTIIARPSVERSSLKGKRRSDVGAILSVELDGGRTMDVDISQSPSKLAADLGKDCIGEMKRQMQAYVSRVKKFLALL